jgi:hypothetical protein
MMKEENKNEKIMNRRNLLGKMMAATTAGVVGSRALAQTVCGITP